jgi:hypothetical protein
VTVPYSDILTRAIEPALAELPPAMTSDAARVLLLAIGAQESRLAHRDQLERDGRNTVLGPALGLWQFERGGGCTGVLIHRASRRHALAACSRHGVKPTPVEVWRALPGDDVFAATMARLLLFTDAAPLPRLGDAEGAWAYYIRCWRPGRPHHKTWRPLYDAATASVRGSA